MVSFEESADETVTPPSVAAESCGDNDSILQFGRHRLHPTLVEALAGSYGTFTDIQTKAIPQALAGKDILVKAQTGSGKTLAALVPIANFLYNLDDAVGACDVIVLIVVPTSELVAQTIQVLNRLLRNGVTVRAGSDVAGTTANVVVTKPKNAIMYAKEHQASLKKVVLDEADLLFEFGFKKETLQLAEVLRHFGRRKQFQTIMLSATLDQDVRALANLILYKPEFIEAQFTPSMGSINEFYVKVDEEDKLLLLYALLKMDAVPYPTLIFTNSDERAYLIKTLLAKLSIESRTLSRLLSPRMRQSLLNSFNQGSIDVLMVADDARGDKLCATRGVDFKSVQCVINFDAPADVTVYTHRIGRTGRMGSIGSSVTLITAADEPLLEGLLADASRKIEPLQIEKGTFDSMRYRVDDVVKGVTKRLVATSQVQALRQSALLEEAFVTTLSKRDEELLKAVVKNDDKKLTVEKKHLSHLPKYLVNDPLRATVLDLQQKINANVRPSQKKQSATNDAPSKLRVKRKKHKIPRKRQPTFKRRKK
ncbi:DEAD/DEAH box helicase, putative [Babesia bigemina]|uniref:ATP-dependent RNA helicase n=1 Tax=Babesia bigemina TaxID=5866 RepID=A0A061DE45_BABBI|nr:DEAD/DEAH box helicase, putative [Babesia bigemina]CDR97974.1 DEAD/DEAH box helicase, putative [Babesia bigemina]|eukprot:XP_012770160.1 DEAD/DEAH box helicase, putative [Babesia bigemina]